MLLNGGVRDADSELVADAVGGGSGVIDMTMAMITTFLT